MIHVSERNKSPIEYVDIARRIVDIINSRMEHFITKISKKYDKYRYIANRIYGYYYEKPIQLSVDAYLNVTYANRIYIKDDKTYQRRVNKLKSAIENYNKLNSVLSVLFGSFKGYFNANAIANIIDLVNKEVEEIKLIMKNDESKFAKLNEIS